MSQIRVKVKAGSVGIYGQVEGKPNMRVSGLGKVWTTRSGNQYQYAYLKYSASDAVHRDRKAGYLR